MSASAAPLGDAGGVLLATTARSGRLVRAILFFWTLFLGALACTNILFSVLAIGWWQRLMARRVLLYWWRRSPARTNGLSFEEFICEDESRKPFLSWPNWILEPKTTRRFGSSPTDGGESFSTRVAASLRAATGSLYQNARLGVQSLFNTWVVTLPACALWLLGWFAGWNNSFHKDYEIAFVGATTALFGVALFVAAMLFLPLAQARHAVSGDRRRFFDLRLLRALRRANPAGALWLAAVFALTALPLNVLLALPAFFPQISPTLSELSPAEAREFLNQYYLWTAVAGFGAVTLVRLTSARVYAASVLEAIASSAVTAEELSVQERDALERLGLSKAGEPAAKHFLTRAITWMGARVFRIVASTVTVLFWLTFVAQIFVREFVHYHPVIGWLNQALVQLPYFSLIPAHLVG